MLVETADGTRMKVVTAAEGQFAEGAMVGLSFTPGEVHLFDSETRLTCLNSLD